jgi:hypothetical protein
MLRTAVIIAGVVGICTVLFTSSSSRALGAQLTKGNRLVLEKKEVRNYERPRLNGNRIAFCTTDGQCGRQVADEFCRGNDFHGALTFQRDRMEGHSAQLRFLRIKCWRSNGSPPAKQAPSTKKNEPLSNSMAKANRR